MKVKKDYEVSWIDLQTGLDEREIITDCYSEFDVHQMLIDGIGDDWQDKITDVEIEFVGYTKEGE